MLRWGITLLVLAAGLVVVARALGLHLELQEARRLMGQGRQVEGAVTETLNMRAGTASAYSYTYAVGASSFTAQQRGIGSDAAQKLRPGSRIVVWHDSAKPERTTTVAEVVHLESWVHRMILPLVGALLIAWALWRIRHSQSPAGMGRPA